MDELLAKGKVLGGLRERTHHVIAGGLVDAKVGDDDQGDED